MIWEGFLRIVFFFSFEGGKEHDLTRGTWLGRSQFPDESNDRFKALELKMNKGYRQIKSTCPLQ